MAKKPRFRLRYTFWLNHLKEDELMVADTIERLKNERSFAQVVRDGIMIVSELRQGKVDLLLKLFPWVADAVRRADERETTDLQRQLERLERLMLERGYVPEQGARPLPQRPELPRPLEPLPEVDYDGNASETFLSAFL